MTDFYTYVHARPSGEPFYVGKGLKSRNRVFSSRSQYHKRTVAKYGRENIIITVLPMETEEDAFEVEKYLIEEYRKAGFRLCNMTDGGEGASGHVQSDYQKSRVSILFKGRAKSTEQIKKMVATRMRNGSYSHSVASCLKISNSLKRIGSKNHTAEWRKKVSLAHLGKPKSPGHIEAMRQAFNRPEIKVLRNTTEANEKNRKTHKKIDNTPEGKIKKKKAAHIRWHFKRGLQSTDCAFCERSSDG